jgi:hypothetical protein
LVPLPSGYCALVSVWKGEEALGHGEGFVDLLLRDAVIDKLEEADVRRSAPELIGDFGLPRLEVAQVDARNVARLGRADAAERPLLLELGETSALLWAVMIGAPVLCRLNKAPSRHASIRYGQSACPWFCARVRTH